jgi:hypothetical protein
MANPVVMVAVLLMAGVVAALGLSILGSGAEATTGADFAVFHTAGELAAEDRAEVLYDDRFAELANERFGGGEDGNLIYLNPPVVAQVLQPLSVLSYRAAFLVWSVITLALTAAALALLRAPKPFWLLAVVVPPAVLNFQLGQNGAVGFVILAGVAGLLRSDRRVAAGLVAALLLFKPTLALGVGVWWLISYRRYWRALLGAAGGGVVIVAASMVGVGVEPWRRFVEVATGESSGGSTWFTTASVTPWELWRELLIGAEWLVMPLWLGSAVVGVLAFRWFVRRSDEQWSVHFAAAVTLTPWLAPHLLIYDWMILFVPAVIVWTVAPELRERWVQLGAWLVIASVVWRTSSPQIDAFGRAIQFGVISYGWVAVQAARSLLERRASAGDEGGDPVLGAPDDGGAVLDDDRSLHQARVL